VALLRDRRDDDPGPAELVAPLCDAARPRARLGGKNIKQTTAPVGDRGGEVVPEGHSGDIRRDCGQPKDGHMTHHLDRGRAESKSPGRAHNRRKDFQQMRDTFQWQLLGDRSLRGVDVKVALALSLHINRDLVEEEGELRAWPGLKTIAERTHVPLRSVRRSVDRLVLFGHFRVISGGCGPGDTNRYVARIKDRETPQ
jgi:hypothetical protein